MKRTITDFLEKELVFEHLRTMYRHFVGTGGYERGEMVQQLAEYLQGEEGAQALAGDLTPEEIELLYVLRQVGGIAPRSWLFRELAAQGDRSAEQWKRVFWNLRKRHITFLIGGDTAYLPEGLSDVIGKQISGQPERAHFDVIPGASAVRQSVHGLVVALLNYMHQNPPRVMAEEERIWKRDLEGMADFFHSYLLESAAGESSIGLIRGRINRLVELLRNMGFLEKRGKRLYIDAENWTDFVGRSEIARQSLLLSFLKDRYENIPLALEALVDWKQASWIPLDRLTEAVRYRTLRSTFHVLRVRPQAEVAAKSPGRRWVSACVYLLADLGLVYTGSDPRGEPVARATDSAVEAWKVLHTSKSSRKQSKDVGSRAYAQPNFELLIPEECSPERHRQIGAVAELRSLDRFWTYVLTPNSVARGVEEGYTSHRVVELLENLVEGPLPPNVRDAVGGWAATAWWVEANGHGTYLCAEPGLFRSLLDLTGVEDRFRAEESCLRPLVDRTEADRWLEEQGIRVVADDRDGATAFGKSARETYARAVEAWKRRMDVGGQGTPVGSYWDDVVPVEPLPQAGREAP